MVCLCYWHGRRCHSAWENGAVSAMPLGDAGQRCHSAWDYRMAGWRGRMAWQDGVGGWRCCRHGRMAWQDGDAVGMAEWLVTSIE